jgi:CHAT domain-containing protein
MTTEMLSMALSPGESYIDKLGTSYRTGPTLQMGYGVSLTDLSGFNQAMVNASGRIEARAVAEPSEAVQAMFKPLEHINSEVANIAEHAEKASLAGNAMTPGEMIGMTVKVQEFMFHCQLTSNIANRSADGLQQLFRQQS